jgi:hypothetical protein
VPENLFDLLEIPHVFAGIADFTIVIGRTFGGG